MLTAVDTKHGTQVYMPQSDNGHRNPYGGDLVDEPVNLFRATEDREAYHGGQAAQDKTAQRGVSYFLECTSGQARYVLDRKHNFVGLTINGTKAVVNDTTLATIADIMFYDDSFENLKLMYVTFALNLITEVLPFIILCSDGEQGVDCYVNGNKLEAGSSKRLFHGDLLSFGQSKWQDT